MAQREMRFTSLLVPGNNIRRGNTLKVLEENIGRKISDIPYSNIFTYISHRARDVKERINKWDFIKIKSFCTAKETISKIKREPIVWENVFTNDTSYYGLISKMYKELTRPLKEEKQPN